MTENAVTLYDRTALAATKAELAATNQQIAEVLTNIRSFVIADDTGAQFLNNILDAAKKHTKAFETRLKAFTAPCRAAEKEARDVFAPVLGLCADIEATIKRKLADRELALAQERAKALAAAQAAFRAQNPEAGRVALAAVPEEVKLAGTSTRTVLRFEVVDAAAVPRELCSPDAAKIEAAVKLGGQIPGVRVWQDVQVSHRTR